MDPRHAGPVCPRASSAGRDACRATAASPGGGDTTVYGTSFASPKAYFPHHIAAISSAILAADSRAVLADAASRVFMLSMGARMPAPRPPVADDMSTCAAAPLPPHA